MPATFKSLTAERSPDPKKIGVLGYADYYHGDGGTSNEIKIADDLPDYDFAKVIRHELGHCFGLGHNEEKYTIMYSNEWYSAEHMTCVDLQAFCDVWGCDAMKMDLCK